MDRFVAFSQIILDTSHETAPETALQAEEGGSKKLKGAQARNERGSIEKGQANNQQQNDEGKDPLTNFFGGFGRARAGQNESKRQARAIPLSYASLPTAFTKRTHVNAASCAYRRVASPRLPAHARISKENKAWFRRADFHEREMTVDFFGDTYVKSNGNILQ